MLNIKIIPFILAVIVTLYTITASGIIPQNIDVIDLTKSASSEIVFSDPDKEIEDTHNVETKEDSVPAFKLEDNKIDVSATVPTTSTEKSNSKNTVNEPIAGQTPPSTLVKPPVASPPSTPQLPSGAFADFSSLTILGSPVFTKENMVSFYNKYKSVKPKLTEDLSITELVNIYYEEAAKEGVRADIAIIQSIIETGWFQFGDQVPYTKNNFCALGAEDADAFNKSIAFSSVRIGIRAHIQYLAMYARGTTNCEYVVCYTSTSDNLVYRYPPIANNNGTLIRGNIKYWTGLSGTWATDSTYSEKLAAKYNDIKNTYYK